MLEKTMKQILIKKINEWIETIDDKEVKEAINKDLIVTGGCFTSMIQNELPNDFDCYFRTKETVIKVANYYAKKWNDSKKEIRNKIEYVCNLMVFDCDNPSQEILNYYNAQSKEELYQSKVGIVNNLIKGRVKMVFPSDGVCGNPDEIRSNEELGLTNEETVTELDEISAEKIISEEKKKYFPVFISTNAITLSDGIQIIVRFYGEPSEIHETYDFEHTKAYFDIKNKKVVIPKEVYELVVNKTLRYTGSRYPVCSIFRVRKFIERGWKINAGQLLKICMQISELDLFNINVLEDQLIGVDSLYFMNLINQFRNQISSDSGFTFDTNYIISIIDKIF